MCIPRTSLTSTLTSICTGNTQGNTTTWQHKPKDASQITAQGLMFFCVSIAFFNGLVPTNLSWVAALAQDKEHAARKTYSYPTLLQGASYSPFLNGSNLWTFRIMIHEAALEELMAQRCKRPPPPLRAVLHAGASSHRRSSPRAEPGSPAALFVLTCSTNPLHSWLLQEKSTQTFLLGKIPSHPPLQASLLLRVSAGDGTLTLPF